MAKRIRDVRIWNLWGPPRPLGYRSKLLGFPSPCMDARGTIEIIAGFGDDFAKKFRSSKGKTFGRRVVLPPTRPSKRPAGAVPWTGGQVDRGTGGPRMGPSRPNRDARSP